MIYRAFAIVEFCVLWALFEAPKLVFSRLTIRSANRSHITKTITPRPVPLGDKIAIVVLFPDAEGFSSDILHLISRLKFAGCDVVAVSNRSLSAESVDQLSEHCHTIHVRKNIGRDFGAYKDTMIWTLTHGDPERVVLLNDSCHYISEHVDGFISKLISGGDFVGSHENFDSPYHLGSFALAFSRKVISSPRFRDYWANYLPIDTRRWTIQKGEIGLSQMVIALGFKPLAIYTPADLYNALMLLPQQDLEDAISLVPRRMANRHGLEQILNRATEHSAAATWKTRLAEKIVQTISHGSQVHSGAFLYARHLKSPLIKKDLLFREVFDPDQLYLATIRSDVSRDIVAEARAKHSTPRGGWIRRRLRSRGFA